MPKIAIIAGEPSGDMLGAQLLLQLHQQADEPVELIGIGGERMADAGLVSAFDMNILAVAGFGFEVISAIPHIYSIYRRITEQIIQFKPDVFIGVDAPGFNFAVEKKLKAHGIKVVHYISPTIWAWRYERIHKIKRITDLVLCIFPQEEPLYAKENIPAKFVGHPLADQIELDIDTNYYKQKLDLSGIVFSVLVGSRSLEVKNLSKTFISACNLIALKLPEITFLFPLANQKAYILFNQILAATPVKFKYKVLLNQTSDAIKASDLVLAKSGTVTLEVALCKKPMIISYKVNRLTEWIVRRKIKIKFVGQPNILLNEAIVPELLQQDATAPNLAGAMLTLYQDEAHQQYMIKRFYELHRTLRKNASYEAALAILELIKNVNNNHHDQHSKITIKNNN